MFIATKDTKVIAIHETEWQCRRKAKGLSKPEYWTWLESVTTEDVPDYSGEDYSVEEVDQDMDDFWASGHISQDIDGDYFSAVSFKVE